MNYANLAAELGIRGFFQGYELRARCPFHNDRNPSFSMNIEKGVWICFTGCGQGEFFDLVERILNCSPQEAHDWVASNGKRTNVNELSSRLASALGLIPGLAQEAKKDSDWRSYYESLNSDTMPLWFLNRGFAWSTINHWNIRYDSIFDSVTIPVIWQKEMVGTVTRNFRQDRPKYENSPNLPRAEILFGEILSSAPTIIICEGVLDTLWLWQCGYNVAGLLGTFLSEGQINILKRYRLGEITLALDNDEAGFKGTLEAVKRLTKAGWLLPQIKVMQFPEGAKDPQDCSEEELDIIYEKRKGLIG